MHTELYLDTARLGRMCRGARLAEQHFCWLVSQLGSPLYLERLLAHGFNTLPSRLQKRVPGLACWQGLEQLGESLGRFVHQPPGCRTYFFGQSTEMMRFAAEALRTRAHRVLVTDLCWPPYLRLVRQIAKQRDTPVILVKLKEIVFSELASSTDIVTYLKQSYDVHGCSGVLLSDISYHGVTLPVGQLVSELDPTFSVIDGAQALHQRNVDLSHLRCDLYITGTQKWFGAFHPLRVAFVGRDKNRSFIQITAKVHTASDHSGGLFRFYEQVRSGQFPPFGTTVNVSPFICAAGALRQARVQARAHHDHWKVFCRNAAMFSRQLVDDNWRCLNAHPSLSSGIVRLRPIQEPPNRVRSRLRQALAERGITATAYEDGALRFSMPRTYLSLQQLSEVERALSQVLFHSRQLIPTCPSTASPPVRNPLQASRGEPSGAMHHP